MRMRVLSWIWGVALGGMATQSVLAAVNLGDLYQQALQSDPVFAAARADRAAAQQAPDQAFAGLLPNVGLSGYTSHNTMDAPSVYRNRFLYNTDSITLSLSQPIYRKANYAAYTQSEFRVKASEAQLAIAEQDLILRLSQAYFDVLMAQDNLSLIEAQKNSIAGLLEQSRQLRKSGVGTVTDVDEALARFSLVRSRAIAATNALENKKRALQRIVGGRFAPLMRLREDGLQLVEPQPNDLEKWVEDAVEHDPQIVLRQASSDYMHHEVEKSRAGHHPTVDFVVQANSAHNPSYFLIGRQTTSSAMVQFNLPLYQGGQVDAKIRESLATEEKARQELEDARRASALQTSESFLAVTSSLAQIEALEEAIKASQTALNSTKMGYQVGLRTNVDVLNAEEQLFTGKKDLSKARYDYIIASLKLKAAVGRLGENDLQALSQWLLAETSMPD